jgi:hypothetical protein
MPFVLGYDLKDNATPIEASAGGRPVEISLVVEDNASLQKVPVAGSV